MGDALIMRSGQPARNLQRVICSLAGRYRAGLDTLTKRLALQQFGHDIGRVLMGADVIHRNNVWVI